MPEPAGSTAWMPGEKPNSEWVDYCRHLSAELDVRIDTSGPVFGHDLIKEEGRRLPRFLTHVRHRYRPRSPPIPMDSRSGPPSLPAMTPESVVRSLRETPDERRRQGRKKEARREPGLLFLRMS